MVNRLRRSSPSSIEDCIRNSTQNLQRVSAAPQRETAAEIDDDRIWRWYVANGVTVIGHRMLPDGSMVTKYFRADGSEVELGDPKNYAYDDLLTPYTDVQGSA